MEKQTAVDWLVNEIAEKYNFRFSTFYSQEINQAKEKEKQQIIDSGNKCCMKKHLHDDILDKMTLDELTEYYNKNVLSYGEEHYNETFNK